MDPNVTQKRAIEKMEGLILKDASYFEHVERYMANPSTKTEVLCSHFNVMLKAVVRDSGLKTVKDRNELKRFLRKYFSNLARGGTPELLAKRVAEAKARQEGLTSPPVPRPAHQGRGVRW